MRNIARANKFNGKLMRIMRHTYLPQAIVVEVEMIGDVTH